MWGTLLADVVIQMLGTDYARIVRAIYAFAQVWILICIVQAFPCQVLYQLLGLLWGFSLELDIEKNLKHHLNPVEQNEKLNVTNTYWSLACNSNVMLIKIHQYGKFTIIL